MTAVKSYPVKDCVSLAHQFGMEYADANGICKDWPEILEAFKPHMIESGEFKHSATGRIIPYWVFKDESLAFGQPDGSIKSCDAGEVEAALKATFH